MGENPEKSDFALKVTEKRRFLMVLLQMNSYLQCN